MAFGAGSEVAHQAVGGMMGGGSRSHHQENTEQTQNNQTQQKGKGLSKLLLSLKIKKEIQSYFYLK